VTITSSQTGGFTSAPFSCTEGAGSFNSQDVKGPYPVHPHGEIGAILPISGVPRIDGHPEGWYVYGPGSDHHPTVSGRDAYVVYLLPQGAIEFNSR